MGQIASSQLGASLGLSSLQIDEVLVYMKNVFWSNSPRLIIMDYQGRCWGLSETQFNNFYNSSNGAIAYGSDKGYNRTDNGTYRHFGGWDQPSGSGVWTNPIYGLSYELEMSSALGYNKRLATGYTPSQSADEYNYYSVDHRNAFDKNRARRIFPWDGTKEDPPNAIPGYYRVSRNNDEVKAPNHFLKNTALENLVFPDAGFITMGKGAVQNDIAFILFAQYINKDDFVSDILINHKQLLNNILNEIYGMNRIKTCMNYIESPIRDFDWVMSNGFLQLARSGQCADGAWSKDWNGYVASARECNSNSTQKWVKEGHHIKNIHSNECLTKGAEGYVISKKCDVNDLSQKWEFVGNRILHKDSGLCLNAASNNLILSDCSCALDLNNNKDNILTKYQDAVLHKYNMCKNKTEFGYDTIGSCDSIITNHDEIGSKFVNWCVENSGSEEVMEMCVNSLRNNEAYNDLYIRQLCAKGDNIVDNKLCASYQLRKRPSDKDRELFDKIAYDTALQEWCAIGNQTGDKKNTCDYLKRRATLFSKDAYDVSNAIWKSYNCVSDMPTLLFLRIMNMSKDDQLSFLEIKFFHNKSMYARNICYSGAAIESGQSMYPQQCFYSQNKLFKVCFDFDGNLKLVDIKNNTSQLLISGVSSSTNTKTVKLNMQPDGNLVCYNADGPYWASNTSGTDMFAVIQNDGRFVLRSSKGVIVKDFTKSSFANGETYESYENHEHCDSSVDYLFVILLFIGLILISMTGYFAIKKCVMTPAAQKNTILFTTKN